MPMTMTSCNQISIEEFDDDETDEDINIDYSVDNDAMHFDSQISSLFNRGLYHSHKIIFSNMSNSADLNSGVITTGRISIVTTTECILMIQS